MLAVVSNSCLLPQITTPVMNDYRPGWICVNDPRMQMTPFTSLHLISLFFRTPNAHQQQ